MSLLTASMWYKELDTELKQDGTVDTENCVHIDGEEGFSPASSMEERQKADRMADSFIKVKI